MLTDFDFALLTGVIITIVLGAMAAVIVAIYQHEEEQTRDRLTLAWVWKDLREPEPWKEEAAQPDWWWGAEPTQCWPMVLELDDDMSEPDPADLPARRRFEFTSRAEAKPRGRAEREPVTLTVALGGGYSDMAVTV